MDLQYSFCWRCETFPLAMEVNDDGGSFTVSILEGSYSHLAVVGSDYVEFASDLEDRLNALTSSGSYTVTYSTTAGYFLSYSGSSLAITLSGTDALENMAKVLGFPASVFLRNQASIARPWFTIIPAIQARSKVSDEYEPEDIAMEAVADSGNAYIVSVEQASILFDWTQSAETNSAPEAAFQPGTPVHRRHGTALVPFTYQEAWRHMQLGGDATNGSLPFYVTENGSTRMHWMRAEGLSFHPTRFAGDDYDLWNIPFLTRTLDLDS